eukprot:5531602-Amphidinium_carterae.1
MMMHGSMSCLCGSKLSPMLESRLAKVETFINLYLPTVKKCTKHITSSSHNTACFTSKVMQSRGKS